MQRFKPDFQTFRYFDASGDLLFGCASHGEFRLKNIANPRLREAIISAEDADFYRHAGLSIPRIIITAIKDVLERRIAGGASTLTQQLARKLFLTPEKSLERKLKEAILAIQIEKRYTKQEIFTLYCNKMYFGQGAYGVEAAARLYFNKSAKDVNLDEAALLAARRKAAITAATAG